MKRLLIACFCVSLLQLVSPASAEIVWITDNSADEEALFRPYTDLLSQFDDVTIHESDGDASAANLAIFNAANLVIIGRASNSGNYTAQATTWNTQITSPLINMNAYINRDNRFTYMDGNGLADTTDAVVLQAILPIHPVWAGIGLDGSNVMVDNFTDGLVTNPDTGNPLRGISVNTANPVNGTLIAQISSGGDANGKVIMEWEPGAVLGNGDVLSSRRMVFNSGARELDGSQAGAYDLTETGQQMFLNAVDYMHPFDLFGIPGDVNDDGVADINDYEIIRDHFQQNVATRGEGDLNRDGVVDFVDFRAWKSNRTAAVPANVSIPEPGCWLLALSAIGTLAAYRKYGG